MSLFPVIAPGPILPSISFLSHTINTSNTSSYTFSGLSFGAAKSSRRMFGIVHFRGNGASRSISSATIGGQTATVHVTSTDTVPMGNPYQTAIISAGVPAGTSGNVVVTLDGSCLRASLGLFRAVDLKDASPTDTTSDINDSIDMSVNAPDKCIVLGGAHMASPGTGITVSDFTVTPFVEQYDAALEAIDRVAGAMASMVEQDFTYVVSFSQGGSGDGAGALLSWR